MKLFREVDEEDIAKAYLAKHRLVAIRRDLAEDLAKIDGGAGSHLMAYDAKQDCYVWRIQVVKHGRRSRAGNQDHP